MGNLQAEQILQAKRALASASTASVESVIGFDGFVDSIIDVVDKRGSIASLDDYTKIKTIAEFGQRISRAAGLSTNIEFVTRAVKLGGNGPIMANALGALGLQVTYMGAVGKGSVHPVFAELAEKARVIPIADPGFTDAVEFSDGKVMLGKIYTLMDLTWENLVAAMPLPDLIAAFAKAKLIATVNWTMIPFMTELWKHILSDVIPQANYAEQPIIFFDLADPQKRSDEDILEALRTIQNFNLHSKAILGLNRKEADQIAEALGLKLSGKASETPLEEITKAIADHMKIYGLVVHPVAQAACVVESNFAIVDGPFTDNPKLTTGAGDNFNAGFCLGQVLGLSPLESLLTGTGTSGFYVRNARSPQREELISFLQTWSENYGRSF